MVSAKQSNDIEFAPAVFDPARLAALDILGILDTLPEQGFDQAVRLTSRLCATPVALVSLVAADRQWFKARVDFPSCETDLDRSVCKFVLAEPDLLVIPDLSADPRTAANPLVTGEPGIRFYAGAPLRTLEGHVIGSLCAIDTVPRPEGLSLEQADDLRALAQQVMAQINLRRAVVERDAAMADQRRREQRLDLMAQASAALLIASDPAASLWPIIENGAEVLGFEQSFVYDVASDGCHLALTYSVGANEATREALRHAPFDLPLCGIVADTRKRLVLGNLLSSTEPRYAIARQSGLDAYAAYPIMSRRRLTGVISFASRKTTAFDRETLTFFATLARFLSVARERLDAEVEVRESDTRSRLAQEAGGVGTFEADVVTGIVNVSEEFCRVFGLVVAPTYPSATIESLVIPEDRHLPSCSATRLDGSAELAVEYRIRRSRHGRLRWISRQAQFVYNDSGRPIRMFGVIRDITERRMLQDQQAALLALGDSLREAGGTEEITGLAAEVLGRTLDVSRAGYAIIDVKADRFTIARDWTAPGMATFAGDHRLSSFGATIDRLKRGDTLMVPNVSAASWLGRDAASYLSIGVQSLIAIPLVQKGTLVGVLFVHAAQARTWSQAEVDFAHGVVDRTYAALAQAQAEADQHVLNEELSHRLKNTFAMVLSIATQTLRSVPDRAPVEAFEKRIHALSSAHDVLLRQSWAAAPLEAVAKAVLGNFGQAERLRLSGPEISLGPRATLSLSLLLHELATNAAKYGALSNEAGRVDVTWRVEGMNGNMDVVLDWEEAGGPLVQEPTGRGFGSRLIRLGLVGTGGVDLRYIPSGFRAEMRAPLAQLQLS